ncbi:hypothetical protein OIDMADRAFT_139587, partial [Oidiodendron maius Zn]
APANSVIEYEVKTRAHEFEILPDGSSYVGTPDNNTDRLWYELYAGLGIQIISKEEASLLPQKTTPVPGYPDQYPILLQAFHEMHCVNALRKTLYPEVYGTVIFSDGTKNMAKLHHLEHCVDLLRETIMCVADTSVGFFIPASNGHGLEDDSRVKRVCRKYENLQEWAKKRQATVPIK